MTKTVSQAVSAVPTPSQADWEVAEGFRRGKGGKYDREVAAYAQLFAHHAEQARLKERESTKPLREAADAMLYAFAEGVDWTPEKKAAFHNLAIAIRKGEAA